MEYQPIGFIGTHAGFGIDAWDYRRVIRQLYDEQCWDTCRVVG